MLRFLNLEKFKSALVKAPFFYRLVLTLLSGITLSFTQAPYNIWPLLFLCFGVLYFLYAQTKTKQQAFLTGFIFALGYFVSGLNWIGNALLVEGNEYRWVWPLAVIALPTLLALFTALYVTISHILFRKDTLSGFMGFCALLTLSEWVRGYAFTGFPWNLYGYGWGNALSMLQSLSLIGPYGLTLLTVFWGCSIGLILTNASTKRSVAVITVLSLIAVYEFGIFRLAHSKQEIVKNTSIHIVQPNIAQADKWKSEKLVENFEQHIALSSIKKTTGTNIIIWPETALPPVFLQSTAVQERITTTLSQNSAILLTGALEVTHDDLSGAPLYHNALSLWKDQSTPKRLYSKSHLVPFGEYIPFQKYIPLDPVTNFSGFARGTGSQTIELGNGLFLSPLICYEIIFPHQAVNKNEPRPDFILTVTNDAWYGNSPGPHQHFMQARFRAIEQGLPVVRSANTGISGLIDPYGHIVKQTQLMQAASITAFLPTRTVQKTFYGMHGDKIFLSLIALCLLTAIYFKQKDFS